MKRNSTGYTQEENSCLSCEGKLQPLPVDKSFLAEEPITSIVSVSTFGDPIFASENLLAVGHSQPFPKPDNLNLSSIRCEYGILVGACPDGIFVSKGPAECFIINIPFVPENFILKTEICKFSKISKPFLFCSHNNSILFFAIDDENPTHIFSHTLEGEYVTSAQKSTDDSFIEAVFSSGIRIKVQNQEFSPQGSLEPLSWLLGIHKNIIVVQRPNFQVLVFKNNLVIGVVPMTTHCKSVFFDRFNVYILASTDTATPMFSKFEHVSMTLQDTVFSENLAKSFSVADQSCVFNTNFFLFYKGALYSFNLLN